MKIECEKIDSNNLTSITLSGRLNFKIVTEEINKINQHFNEERTYRTLLKLQNVEWEFNLFEIYGIVKYLVSHLSKFHDKVAILVTNKQELKNAKIMGIFLNDRGFNIKVFSSQAVAIKWLDGSV